MRLVSIFAGVAAIASTAQACFQIHAQLVTNPLIDDVMYMQLIYNSGGEMTEICRGSDSDYASSSLSVFMLDCGQYYVEVTNNGRAGRMEIRYDDGTPPWTYTVELVDTANTDYCCSGDCEGSNIGCSAWDNCLRAAESCGSEPDLECPLCNNDWSTVYCEL